MGSWTNTLCAGMCAVYSFFGGTLALSMRDCCELNRRRLRQLLRLRLRPWLRAGGCCAGHKAPLSVVCGCCCCCRYCCCCHYCCSGTLSLLKLPRRSPSPLPPTPPLFLSPLVPFSTLPQGAQTAQGLGRCTNIIHWGTRRRFIFLTILSISSSTLPPRPTFSLATGMSPMRADSGLHAA